MRLGGLFHLCTDTTGARVALLDLSPELLAVAKKRVAGLGLAEHVDCIVLDVTDAKAVRAPRALALWELSRGKKGFAFSDFQIFPKKSLGGSKGTL